MTVLRSTLALLVLGLPGLLPALVAAGVRPASVLLAPLIGCVLASTAATLSLLAGGTPLPWFGVLIVGANLAAVVIGCGWRLRRRSIPPPRSAPGERSFDWLGLGVVLGVGALPLLGLAARYVGYDTRSIWFLHARLLMGGSDIYASTFDANPIYTFSHTGYPPLLPGSLAVVWQATGSSTTAPDRSSSRCSTCAPSAWSRSRCSGWEGAGVASCAFCSPRA